MKKRIDACKEIFERIKAVRVTAGLQNFVETPTTQAKPEDMPVCFMGYGVDSIIKRSARTATASRKGEANVRSVEVILEFVAHKDDDVLAIYEKVRAAVLADIHPLKDVNGVPDPTTYMYEDRTEGPIGYGLPEVEAMIFVITLVYKDEI